MAINEQKLSAILFQNWWALLLRGVVAIAFGVLTWLQPGISIAAMVLTFGAFCCVDGMLCMWTAIAGREIHEDWWVLLVGGAIGIGIGVLTLTVPQVSALALLFYIAVWAIGTGLLQIIAALRLRNEIEGEWLFILAGLASVLFGLLLMARPEAGALAVLWLIALFAVVYGILLVLLALRVRSFGRQAIQL